MRYWVSHPYGYTALKSTPAARASKLLDLSPNAILEGTETTLESDGIMWRRVIYITAANQPNYVGWVDEQRIERYYENFPINCVDVSDIATPSNLDFQQYVNYNGRVQYNFCGQMAVCFLLNIPRLSDFLQIWKIGKPGLYKRIFGEGKASGTGPQDLVDMFALYDRRVKIIKEKYYTPYKLSQMGSSIVSVHIDHRARLKGDGVLHWVAPISVFEEGAGDGYVMYYDPAKNRVRVAGYDVFETSARAPYGVMPE